MDNSLQLTAYSLRLKARQLRRSLLLAAMLMGGVTAQAQEETVTVGTGNSNSSYGVGSPFYEYYGKSTTASLYTSTEIGQSGCISAIAYNCTSTGAFTGEVHVYMATVDKTAFSGNNDWPTSYTEVYSNNSVTIATSTGWNTLTLNTPYYYNQNTGSLVVIITISTTWKTQSWAYTSTSNTYLYRGSDSDNNYADVTNTSNGTRGNNRPNIRLTFKKFYFSATAIATAGGTASVSPQSTNVVGTTSCSSATTTATFTATPNSGFLGWSETESGSIVSTDNPYAATITSTSTTSANPTNTTLYARFQANVNPTAIAANNASVTTYVGTPISVGYTLTPADAYDDVTGTSSSPSIFTVGAISNGSAAITPVAVGTATLTLTAHKINGDAISPAATVTVNVRDRAATPVITFTPTGSDNKASCEITCTTPGTTIRYTVNGSDPTASDNLYGSAFEVNDGDVVRAKAFISTDGWDNSAVATKTWAACSATKPSISNTASGSTAYVSITAGSGDVIYYTTDGGTPSDNSTLYTGTFTSSNGATVKAIAYHDGCHESDIATYTVIGTSVSGGIVTINDYEDHNWSYYQSSANLPTGYPTEYLSSPDPRNVKITYMRGSVSGASGAAISGLTGEGDTMMVYYKTLEKSVPGMTGDYPYTVISNPYSKRPKNGSTYYGFAGWKLYSGGNYISEYSNGETLPLDATIHFTNLNTNYTANCTSAEIVFVATWTTANVQSETSAPSFSGGTYETNFWVLNGNVTNLSVPANVTVTARYPDGSDGYYNSATITGTITAGGNNAKVEFVKMNSTGAVSAVGYTFTMGRGIENSGNGGAFNASTTNKETKHTVKVESGKYSQLRHFTQTISDGNAIDQLMILGCDYDRAMAVSNSSYNTKLNITGTMYLANQKSINRTAGTLYCRTFVKSGNFISGTTVDNNYTGEADQCYYFSGYGSNNRTGGRRILTIEGGHLRGISGGTDVENNTAQNTSRAFELRVRGTAQIDGVIYGGAQYAAGSGHRTMIFTGGTVGRWIAGGANGTNATGGNIVGDVYIYFGGTATQTGTHGIYGAGYGSSNYAQGTEKYTVGKSTIVVADECQIAGNAYGGGNNGYATNNISVFVTGGTVAGDIYGGANKAPSSQNVGVVVTGGSVAGGVYGGSNQSGAISGQVTVDVYGTDPQPNSGYAIGQVFGGGNQAAYTGTPKVTVHCTDEATPISIGEVYGGGNRATVTGTDVKVYAGNRIGYVYGGGKAADVGSGGTSVNIYGGTIGHVFGGNNKSGEIASNATGKIVVNVEKNGSCPLRVGEVYGGGNEAASQAGTITIGCTGDIVNGDGGHLAHPENIGHSLEGIGDLYGGARQANITAGNISLTMTKGMVNRVFGGNNVSGSISGSITVNINKDDGATCASDWYCGEVYGGGNQAHFDKTPDVNMQNGTVERDIYGGGNNITADDEGVAASDVEMTGGTVKGSVYGGCNYKGTVKGTTSVAISAGTVGVNNVATGGCVYGGGLGSLTNVTGKATVTISGTATIVHDVFGGGSQGTVGSTQVTVKD